MQITTIQGLSPHGPHDLSVRIWGDTGNPNVIICAHGLTRNSSDFHFLGQALEKDYCVYAMDMIGRGQSTWPEDANLYTFPQYMADFNSLLTFVGQNNITWLGTSLGGLFGMIFASIPNSPIKRLIINDVAPKIPQAAFFRIKAYAGIKMAFENKEQADLVLREIFKPFGIQDPGFWDYFLDNTLKRDPDGTWTMAYDPRIISGVPAEVIEQFEHIDLYPYWDQLKCPILLLHGENSDILTPELLKEMQSHPTPFELAVIKGIGHAPTLFPEDQISRVRDWLEKSNQQLSSPGLFDRAAK